MIRCLLVLLLLATPCAAGVGIAISPWPGPGVMQGNSDPCTGLSQYAVCESFNGTNDCDGAGALTFTNCTNSGWITAGDGTINFAKTGISSVGTYNLEVEEATTDTSARLTFTESAVVSSYSLVEMTDVPLSTDKDVLMILSSADVTLCTARVDCDDTDCTLQPRIGSTNGINTVGTLSQGTTEYHIWLDYSNTDNTCTVAFSSDGIKPTSGNNYSTITASISTDGAKVNLPSNVANLQLNHLKVRVRTDGTLIGSDPL